MPSSNSDSSIDDKLRRSRLELLDIGLRNNLVSFRKTSKSLTILGAEAGELFSALLTAQKPLPFEATIRKRSTLTTAGSLEEEQANIEQEMLEALFTQKDEDDAREALGPSPGSGPTAKAGRSSRRSGPVLQAALTPEALFVQLLKMRSEAQTFVEEQGANLLFLAVGFLHWYETDSAQEARSAPLVLIPCSLVREGASERFQLEPTGDDVVVNLSLGAKLKTDFGITLPMPDEGTEEESTDWLAYFAEVAKSIAVHKRWSVRQDEVVLGFFSFGKFLMFKDLDPETWPEDKQPSIHPVIGRLMGEGFSDQGPAFEEDVNVDAVIAPGDVHFVKDADSSQTQAILEVREGRNLVIQGPPGTGKSQTITNLIAELIGQKKSVLFVAVLTFTEN